MTTTDSFWSRYDSLCALLLAPLSSEDGGRENEIAGAEERLGFRLPHLLREFYARTGNHSGLTGAHDRLCCPSALRVSNGGLVFWEENQGVMLWGIPFASLAEDDPPVIAAGSGDQLAWEEYLPRLSAFLLETAVWQCVCGAMTYTGVGTVPEARILNAPTGWDTYQVAGNPAFVRDGQALYLMASQGKTREVHAGARTWPDLQAIQERFAAEWDYLEPDEDIDGLTEEELARDLELSPADLAAIEAQKRAKSQTPYGEAGCSGCGRPLRVWADSARNVCGFCGSAL